MLARCIARRVTRLRTTRALSRSVYEFAPGHHATFEESGIPPLYQAPPPPEETRTGWELKSHLTAEADFNEPELDDEGLLQFYRDMIYSGSEGLIESVSEVIDVNRRIREDERRRMISSMMARLQGLKQDGAGLGKDAVARPTEEQTTLASPEAGPSKVPVSASTAIPRPSLRVLDMLSSLHIPQTFDSGNANVKGKRRMDGPILPLGLLSFKEWQALFEDLMSQKDLSSAEQVLTQMGQHGFPPVQAWAEKLVTAFAQDGDIDAVNRLNRQMAQVFSDAAEYQATVMTAIITRYGRGEAIANLKQHEHAGTPLAQKAYQVVLHHLNFGFPTYRPDSHSRALARDLFAHMRLVAHPTPDRGLYRDMITACAASSDPQPERARDLWLEMTTEGDAPACEPEKEDYNAIIRALSTSKDDYLEGFDIFRQMLSKHQDAVRVPFDDTPRATFSKYIPTLRTFSALLQGTKRAGDLERTRWLLLEMVKLVQAASLQTNVEIAGPDANIMADVFHAYATWIPKPQKPLKTTDSTGDVQSELEIDQVHGVSDAEGDYSNVDMTPLRNASDGEPETDLQAGSDTVPHYTPSPLPHTHAQAVSEATGIWERLLYDVKAARAGNATLIEYPFSQVWLSQRVITAYQSVILNHTWDIAIAKDLWGKVYKDANEARGVSLTLADEAPQSIEESSGDSRVNTRLLRPDGWSYTEALERCAHPPKMHQQSPERRQQSRRDWSAAMAWAQELWQGYIQLLDGAKPIRLLALGGPISPISTTQPGIISKPPEARAWLYNFGLGDRQIEKAYTALIRTYANAGQPLEGLKVLLDFRRRFDPMDITDTFRPLAPTGLSMQVEDPTSLAEPNVPPALTWNDLSMLHQALVEALQKAPEDMVGEYEKGLATVKNLSKTYEAALYTRRRWRMRNNRARAARDGNAETAEYNNKMTVKSGPSRITYTPSLPLRAVSRAITPGITRSLPTTRPTNQPVSPRGVPDEDEAELDKIIAANPAGTSGKYLVKAQRVAKGRATTRRPMKDWRQEKLSGPGKRPIMERPSGVGKRPVMSR